MQIVDSAFNLLGKLKVAAFLRIGDDYRNLDVDRKTGLPRDLPYNPYDLPAYIDRVFSASEKLAYTWVEFTRPALGAQAGQTVAAKLRLDFAKEYRYLQEFVAALNRGDRTWFAKKSHAPPTDSLMDVLFMFVEQHALNRKFDYRD